MSACPSVNDFEFTGEQLTLIGDIIALGFVQVGTVQVGTETQGDELLKQTFFNANNQKVEISYTDMDNRPKRKSPEKGSIKVNQVYLMKKDSSTAEKADPDTAKFLINNGYVRLIRTLHFLEGDVDYYVPIDDPRTDFPPHRG